MRNHLLSVMGAAALGLCFGVTATYGHVIDPDVNKDAAKLRKNVGKQGSKHVFCLVKAATKCEEDGTSSGVECHLDTGVVDFDPGGPAEMDFQGAIAKCDEKYDPTKKGTDYVGIGCPGDCVNGATDGVQQCANMSPAYEATVEGTVAPAAKAQLPGLAATINTACGLDGIGANDADPVRIECVRQNADTLGRYGRGLFKCAEKCENDFKDKKGNGGGSNLGKCTSNTAETDPNFDSCDVEKFNKAVEKGGALSPTNAALTLVAVRTAINIATNGLYNRSDPTDVDPTTSTLSPCGTCGDGIQDGAEECDMSDDALCGGPCNANCTCP
jgi:hypothetical protein